MDEKNKFKIILTDNSFDVTLNSGESMDLHLKNENGKIYLTNMPTQQVEKGDYNTTDEKFAGNGYKSVSYRFEKGVDNISNGNIDQSNKIQSSIYGLLSNHQQPNHAEKDLKEDVKTNEENTSELEYEEESKVDIQEDIENDNEHMIDNDTADDEVVVEEEMEESITTEEDANTDTNIETLKRKYFPIDDEEE